MKNNYNLRMIRFIRRFLFAHFSHLDVFTPILERVSLPKEEHKYIMSFYIRGLMGIVAEWLKNDCSDEVDHVVAIIQRCVGYSGKEMV